MKKLLLVLPVLLLATAAFALDCHHITPICVGWKSCSPCINGQKLCWNDCETKIISCGTPPVCTPNWSCGDWGACVEGTATRACTDLNHCGTNTGKPTTTQSCTPQCTPNTQCSSWGNCANGHQSRWCSDGCNPVHEETRTCTDGQCTPNTCGTQCGSISDGCGGTLNCGTCESGQGQGQPTPAPTFHVPVSDGAWVPIINGVKDYTNPCRMNTYISKYCQKNLNVYDPSKCYQPKRVFTICWDNTTSTYQQSWIANYGDYMKQKEWVTSVGKWLFTWWALK